LVKAPFQYVLHPFSHFKVSIASGKIDSFSFRIASEKTRQISMEYWNRTRVAANETSALLYVDFGQRTEIDAVPFLKPCRP
jgi:hypothetical protein